MNKRRNIRNIRKVSTVEFLLKEPKIVLDRSFVDNYLRSQKKSSNAIEQSVSAANTSIISLDSSSDELDDSVVFVSEEKKEQSPNTKIAALSKENANQKKRIRNLEIHVTALQKSALKEKNNHQNLSVASTSNTDLNLSIDGAWLLDEVNKICGESDLSLVQAEMDKYLNQNE